MFTSAKAVLSVKGSGSWFFWRDSGLVDQLVTDRPLLIEARRAIYGLLLFRNIAEQDRDLRNPLERITSREGVNAAQAFFERNGCIFQEIAQQNDFGKDAYVDLGEGGAVTFLCVTQHVLPFAASLG
jgi:hypothetical protein